MLWETLPDVPVTVSVKVPAGVPVPDGGGVWEPPPAKPAQPLARVTSRSALLNANTTRPRRPATRARNAAAIDIARIKRIAANGGKGRTPGMAKPRAVVVIETDTDVPVPLGVTDAGVTVQVEALGAPTQVKEIAWLNPSFGLMTTVNSAD